MEGGPEARRAARERIVIVPTGVYWAVLGLSLFFLALGAGSYREYLPSVSIGFYVATIILAGIIILWSLIGLSRRGRILHRSVGVTKRSAHRFSDAFQRQQDAHEGALGRFFGRWGNRVKRFVNFWVRLVLGLWRFVLRVTKWPRRIIIWTYYTVQKIALRLTLIAYELLYYPLYAAWRLALWAWRTAGAVLWFALRVAWKVLKIPTKLPILRGLWAHRMRPPILAKWRAVKAQRHYRKATRIHDGRVRAEENGLDPDAWEADHQRRRGFPLPVPDKFRTIIRTRLTRIREVQKARLAGGPVPGAEERAARKREKRRKKKGLGEDEGEGDGSGPAGQAGSGGDEASDGDIKDEDGQARDEVEDAKGRRRRNDRRGQKTKSKARGAQA